MASQDSYRLPRHTRPQRYELELRPHLGEATFEGSVTVDLEVTGTTDRLTLNAAELDVHTARLERDGETFGAGISLDESEQQLIVDLGRPLSPGPARLHIAFSGRLNDQLRGFYRSTFRDASGAEQVIATTQFEATDARRAFPCWDEPDFKATFAVTLVVEGGLTALSNGAVASTEDLGDGRRAVRFAETMPMSTYLVAFAVGPFECTDPVQVDGVPVRVVAAAGKQALTAYPLEVAAHSLRFLSGYFGIPYPSDKLDHVAIPDFAFGAMENLGCVTYRESLLLADPAVAAQTELQRISAVVAHETAHMWFGDLVTMKWWNGIWLNEAFATFMELTTADDFRPDWQVWTAFGAGKAAAMETDGLHATRPVEYPVGRPEEADGMFDVLTYQKGGAVLKMLEQYLGAEVFRKGIAHYLSTHSFANTETADLWEALESVSGEPVRTIMDSWINQGGYPVVSAGLADDASTVVLTQRRFLYDGSQSSERWAVPVNLRASIAGVIHHERLLLDQAEGRCSFPGPVDWVVVNDGSWGFYRTRYSDQLWRRLVDSGTVTSLGPLERLQLLGDTWAAVITGEAGLSVWAEAAQAVASEADPDVWGSILVALRVLDLAADDAERDRLQAFVRRLAAPAWRQVGWVPAPGESDRVATARGRILVALADYGGDRELIEQARHRFTAHLAGSGPSDGLAPDLVGPAARITVAAGGPSEWETVLDAYRRAANSHEQLRYLYALGRVTSEKLLLRTLEWALGPEVRSQDAPFLIAPTVGLRRGGRLAWSFVEDNWGRISDRLPPALHIRVLEALAAIVDADIARSAHEFVGREDIRVAPIRLRQVIEGMDVNVALGRRLRGSIATGLSPD